MVTGITLLTFCPPGPLARTKVSWISASSICRCSVTGIMAPAYRLRLAIASLTGHASFAGMSKASRLLALAALGLSVAACGGEGGSASGGAAAAPELTDAQRQTILASLPAPYNAGDLDNGRKEFGQCRSCHTIQAGGPNLTGPNLHGVFGRKAGTVPNYAYSEALVATGWTWDQARLDGWLANPREYLPGTKMSFAGIRDATDRRDLIAYLSVETAPAP